MSRRLACQGLLVAGLFVSGLCAQSRPATGPATFDLAEQLTYGPSTLVEDERFLAPIRAGDVSQLPVAEGAPEVQATTYLAWANRLLAIPTGRAATRWLIGIDAEGDQELLSQCGQASQEYVERAKASLKSADDLPRREKRKLQNVAFTLEAFAGLFRAADPAVIEGSAASTYRRSGRTLAVVGEDVDPVVASCAQMWQAFAWQLAGRRERAMASLPGALQKPNQLPYDFLSRLLRCRIVLEADQPVTATALTVRIRVSCDRWFSSDKVARSAARLAALLQMRATQAWLKALGDSDPEASDRLRAILADVQAELFPPNAVSDVYFLEEAVPILIAEPKPPTTQPTTTTATAPAGDASRPTPHSAPGASPPAQ
jgi:hypothetical protein